MEKQNELEIVIKESGLEISQSTDILKKFNIFFEQAKEWEVKAKFLVVKNENDIEIMSQAREARLALKKIRTEAENVRKNIKENYVRTGKAIDGVANVIKALIIPIEEHLEKQEKFIELLKEEKAKTIKAERISKLLAYIPEENIGMYNLDVMNDEVFDNLLASIKKDFEEKAEKERLIEEEKLKEIEEQKKKDEEMRIENAKMKKEKEIEDIRIVEEKKHREVEDKEKEEAHQKELQKIADELKKKEDDEKTRIAEEKRVEEEKAEKERQSKLAPEKDKLTAYAERIRLIESPDGLSKAGLEVVRVAEEKLLEISQEIKLKIKEL